MKKKYCIVGLGSRGIGMFLIPLVRDYADVAEVTGLCDINWRRLEVGLFKLIPLRPKMRLFAFNECLWKLAGCHRLFISILSNNG